MTQEDEAILLGPDVRRMVKKLSNYYTRDQWNFEDSVQNGMLYAMNYLRRFPDDPRDKAFYIRLYGYLRGKIGAHMVSRIRYQKRVESLEDPSILQCPDDVAYDHMVASEIPQSVTEAMDHINKANLDCIKLHYLGGMNFERIGEKLNISRHLARTRVEYGIKQIRRYLKGLSIEKKRGRKPKLSRCSIESCGQVSKANGMCSTHYMRVRRYGDPHVNNGKKFSSDYQPLKQSSKMPEIGIESGADSR